MKMQGQSMFNNSMVVGKDKGSFHPARSREGPEGE